ncbi:MAG: hypothetical protein ACM31L_02495 [Actinomycetota bacterium]
MSEHIQIGDVSPRIQYVGDGVLTAFIYPFPVFAPADIEVYLGSARQAGGYTVSGAGTSGGGTVIFAQPPADGMLVTLRRNLAIKRTTDHQADGVIRAKTINDEFDYQTAAIQQVAEDSGRAVRRSVTSPSTADLTLPEPVAGRSIKWNGAGTGLENSAADTDSVLAAATAQAAAAQDAATSAAADAAATAADRAAARADRLVADADAAATAADRAAVAADRTAADADAAATAADRAAARADRLAADADAAATATDRTAVAADRATVAADKVSVAADKASVAADKAAAAASAAAAGQSASDAAASAAQAQAAADVMTFKTVRVAGQPDVVADQAADTLTLAAGANIALSSDAATDTVTVAVTGLGTAAQAALDTDTALAANSDARVPSQKAVAAYVAANAGPDLTADVGQLYLAVARLDTPTSPNAGGTQVADEFDDATGVGSLGGATVTGGYLTTGAPGTSLIPQATGTPIGSSATNGGLAACFDGNTAQPYSNGGGTCCHISGTTGYVGKDYGSAGAYAVTKAEVFGSSDLGVDGGGNGTMTLTLLGSDTNNTATATSYGTWTGADSSDATMRTITATSPAACRYWWVKVQVANGDIYFSEVRFYVATVAANVTAVSAAYAAQSAPTKASLVAEYLDVSATAVVNTDIAFDVSRDGGTTWTAVAMTDFGPSPIAGARVLKGTTSVTGQPTGTAMKWRIRTLNGKEQRIHGIWMQWR